MYSHCYMYMSLLNVQVLHVLSLLNVHHCELNTLVWCGCMITSDGEIFSLSQERTASTFPITCTCKCV